VTVTWDLLLPTLPHRHAQLCALLAEIDRQWQPGLGMLLYRDNLQRPGNASYGKWQDLQEASKADYTSFIGDDDFIAPGYIAKVMAALETGPDYVGYKIRYTRNGRQMMPVEHRLSHGDWRNTPDMLYRDIGIHNPIKRELALLATWATDHQSADVTWARDLRNTGRVKDEVWIPEELYYYQEATSGEKVLGSWSLWGGGVPQPMLADEIKPVPEYPWLTVRDEALA
jgi:hypothetical protein